MTERNIGKYLHFYIGSEIQIEYGYHDDKKVGILTGFRAGAGWEIWPHKEMFVKMPVGERVVPAIVRDDLVKPILRNLADITDEEMIAVCELYNPLPFQVGKRANWVVDRTFTGDYQYIGLKNDRNDFSFNMDCKYWALEMYNKQDQCEAQCQMKSIQYLLSKGFDLFELIESKLAINKSTIQK